MKQILKRLLTSLSLLNLTFISSFRILFYSYFWVRIKKINAKSVTDCYILGNGPSLRENLTVKLDILRNKELFVVNDFAKSDFFEVLKPRYYVLLDPSYWDEYTFEELRNDCIQVLYKIRDKTDWNMYFIIPNEAIKTSLMKNIFGSNPHISMIDYNSTVVRGYKWFNYWAFKKNMGIPPVNNVVGACILLATNMRYKEINLLGTDHSWTKDLYVNSKNQVCTGNPHFYDKEEEFQVPHRTVYGEYYTMHRLLRDYAKMFEGYHTLRDYAEKLNVKILNRTTDSFIDAFERRDF